MAYITGYHAIEERIRQGRGEKLYYDASIGERVRRILHQAHEKRIPTKPVSKEELKRMVPGREPRGVVLFEKERNNRAGLKQVLATLHTELPLALVLDSVQDPHNLGAIIRSADQFQAEGVVIPEKRSVKDTPTVSKVSSGADSYLPLITVTNLSRALDLFKEAGFWVYGADMEGEPAPNVQFHARTVIVMGGEGKGLRRLVREKCDVLVRIPAFGHVDSFNVSVAAGILMYEVRRQQDRF